MNVNISKHIETIFQKLIAAGLKLKESKCDFFKKEIHYLGHLISSEGIHPLPGEIETQYITCLDLKLLRK